MKLIDTFVFSLQTPKAMQALQNPHFTPIGYTLTSLPQANYLQNDHLHMSEGYVDSVCTDNISYLLKTSTLVYYTALEQSPGIDEVFTRLEETAYCKK